MGSRQAHLTIPTHPGTGEADRGAHPITAGPIATAPGGRVLGRSVWADTGRADRVQAVGDVRAPERHVWGGRRGAVGRCATDVMTLTAIGYGGYTPTVAPMHLYILLYSVLRIGFFV